MPLPRLAVTKTCNRVYLYFHPPQSLEAKHDINTMFYLSLDEHNAPAFVPRQTIVQMKIHPKIPTPEISTLKMRPMDLHHETRPGHIPNFEDGYGIRGEGKAVIKWCLENLNTIPRNLQQLIDPRPVLDLSIPPVRLFYDSVYLCMGTYTDAFQVVDLPLYECLVIIQIYRAKDSKERGPFNIVVFDPVSCPSSNPFLTNLPLDTRMVCWNVRGIARESFLENFTMMYEAVNPSLVILLETRHVHDNVNDVVSKLPRFRVLTSFIESCSGGTAILYKDHLIKALDNPIFSSYTLQNVVIQGRKDHLRNKMIMSNKKLKGKPIRFGGCW